MANLNKLFLEFNSNITLGKSKKENLKIGRNALRNKIKEEFAEKARKQPKFSGQGSYMMKTTINPINDGEYDIDDGVYLQGFTDKEIEEWPVASTVHSWIKKSVENHTKTNPIDKNTCVRVVYAKDYHIDLPTYIVKDNIAYLAHKSEGWIKSDPRAFTEWFIGKVNKKGEQLRSLVKYLKAWKDYTGVDLKGISITILVGENFYEYENRDDLSLIGTLTNIIEALEDEYVCIKPVTPNEDLFDSHSDNKKNVIINALKNLRDAIQNAVDTNDEKKASDIMIKYFGDRFPKGESLEVEEKSEFIKTEAPAIIRNDGRSA